MDELTATVLVILGISMVVSAYLLSSASNPHPQPYTPTAHTIPSSTNTTSTKTVDPCEHAQVVNIVGNGLDKTITSPEAIDLKLVGNSNYIKVADNVTVCSLTVTGNNNVIDLPEGQNPLEHVVGNGNEIR